MGTWTPGPGPTAGDDSYQGDATDEYVNGGLGFDTIYGRGGNDILVAGGSSGNDWLYGGAGSDTIYGGSTGVTYMVGGEGGSFVLPFVGPDDSIDYFYGGAGGSFMFGSVQDRFYGHATGFEDAAYSPNFNGFSLVNLRSISASGTGTLADGTVFQNIDRITIAAQASTAVTVYGHDGSNYFFGSNFADKLYGYAGGDALAGHAGNDLLDGGDGDDSLNGGDGKDTLYGGAGYNWIYGDAGADVLYGGGDVNYMDGGDDAAIDWMYGGPGINIMYGKSGDRFIGSPAATDSAGYRPAGAFTTIDLRAVSASGDSVLADGTRFVSIESFIVYGNDSSATTIFGSERSDNINGGSVADVLHGNGGADTLNGNRGNDRLRGGAGADGLYGGDGNDFLDGGLDDDLLNGGSGIDTLAGSWGNDTYEVDSRTDIIQESASQGTDTVRTTALVYTLGANLEDLTGPWSMESFRGTGNALNNRIVSFGGNDVLDGGAGADTLSGSDGDDVYIVDSLGDVVEEGGGQGGQGVDTIRTALNAYTLPTSTLSSLRDVENLVFTGSGAFSGTGNLLDNVITGGGTSDIVDGDAGSDTFLIRYASASGAVIADVTSVTVGGATVATLTSIERLNITSGAGADSLTGGALADVFDGSVGADTMTGGDGNDIYYVDNAGDVITEALNEGTDAVFSAVTITLSANIESLALTGTAGIGGAGNALSNLLIGNSGNNFLNGAQGADVMRGGLGNDVYIVDNAGDVIIEAANAGADVVRSAVSYALAANVENLTFMGMANLNGTGNALANSISGNAGGNALAGGGGNDVLNGAAGNDTLYGGGGADWLFGGAGQDVFVFNTALGATQIDSVRDYSVADDTIWLDNAIFTKFAATGALNAAYFRVGAAAADANDYIIYDSSTGALFYDANGNGVGGAVQIATLSAGLALTNADFLVI